MAKLSTAERFVGISLILIGFIFFIAGFAVLFFSSSMIIDIITIFFGNVDSAIFLVGLLTIIFGLLLIYAGRLIRRENFFPDYLRGLMK